ncbi:MAG: hypothetical protein ACRDJX_06580, partial [Solirubrobacteraceae bacterium]
MSQGVGGTALAVRAPKARGSSRRVPARLQIYALLKDQRWFVLASWATGMLAGFTESVIMATIAETAATIAQGAKRAHLHIGPLHTHPAIDTLLLVALGLVGVRLLLQVPLSILPTRIITRVQAGMRMRMFNAYTRTSWDVQARDREGQLQETMTGQVGQATVAVQSATGLVASALILIVLMSSAFVLNAVAASFVVVLTTVMLGALRPLRSAGRRRARALSQSQVEYARGMAESIRVAEETQVFGGGAAQRERIEGLVATARKHALA